MINIIFFGSDEYSAIVLENLHTGSVKISAVITTPKKPQGRKQELVPNEVENLAIKHNIKVLYYPPNIDELNKLINHETIGVSASFGRIISADILKLFPTGIYNLHPSLLPQYRNVAPVPYALAMGDEITGITIFQMDEKIDNGKNILQIEEKILPTDSSPILLMRLFQKGSDELIKYLSDSLTSRLADQPIRRLADNLVFTRKLSRMSGFLEWPLFQKYLLKEIFTLGDTVNPLLTLRLTHHPERNNAYSAVGDLSRALAGWERLWTIAPGKHGEQEIYISSLDPLMIQIPGKPKSISYADFTKYYLTN